MKLRERYLSIEKLDLGVDDFENFTLWIVAATIG